MFRTAKCLLLAVLFSATAYAQSSKPGSWGILTMVLPSDTGHRVGGFAEAQVQTDGIKFDKFYYDEFKGGISYAINHQYIVLLGAGRYSLYDPEDLSAGPQQTENRLWQQLSILNKLGRLVFEHRYRAEQRWIDGDYRSRFRYRLNLMLPLNHPTIRSGTVFISVFDELFLGLKAYSFETNRISATLGYKLSSSATFRAGWIFQDNNSLLSHNEKHNLLVGIMYQIGKKDLKNNTFYLP